MQDILTGKEIIIFYIVHSEFLVILLSCQRVKISDLGIYFVSRSIKICSGNDFIFPNNIIAFVFSSYSKTDFHISFSLINFTKENIYLFLRAKRIKEMKEDCMKKKIILFKRRCDNEHVSVSILFKFCETLYF